jgi:hypothetical protein
MNVKWITMKDHMQKNDEIFAHHWGCPETSGQLEWKILKDETLN